jgi:hypothetical protein
MIPLNNVRSRFTSCHYDATAMPESEIARNMRSCSAWAFLLNSTHTLKATLNYSEAFRKTQYELSEK